MATSPDVTTVEILTLQKVRDQKSSRVVTAGQSFLCQVSLDLQCKQVPERVTSITLTHQRMLKQVSSPL